MLLISLSQKSSQFLLNRLQLRLINVRRLHVLVDLCSEQIRELHLGRVVDLLRTVSSKSRSDEFNSVISNIFSTIIN